MTRNGVESGCVAPGCTTLIVPPISPISIFPPGRKRIAGTKLRFWTTTSFANADAPLTVVAVLTGEYGPEVRGRIDRAHPYRYVVDAVTPVSENDVTAGTAIWPKLVQAAPAHLSIGSEATRCCP